MFPRVVAPHTHTHYSQSADLMPYSTKVYAYKRFYYMEIRCELGMNVAIATYAIAIPRETHNHEFDECYPVELTEVN